MCGRRLFQKRSLDPYKDFCTCEIEPLSSSHIFCFSSHAASWSPDGKNIAYMTKDRSLNVTTNKFEPQYSFELPAKILDDNENPDLHGKNWSKAGCICMSKKTVTMVHFSLSDHSNELLISWMRFLLCQFHTQPWQLTFSSDS